MIATQRSFKMVTRLLVPVCASVWVSVAWGLGLGSLEVQSNLDQPLDGIIELRLAEGDDIASIDARIASRDEFEDLGIDYPEYLGAVRLVVEQRAGASVLRILSDSVINEPFVHLLIRVDWSGGSFLREYTALIDPPVYAADTPPAISQPRVIEDSFVAPESQPRLESDINQDIFAEEPADTSVEPSFDAIELSDDYTQSDDYISFEDAPSDSFSDANTGVSQSDGIDAQYGPVVAGETLSQIARDLQAQFPDLSIYQIMKVMFEENRGAFIEGNINGLLAGSILKIGDINAIRAVDLADATDFYREQLQDWDPSYLIADSSFANDFSAGDAFDSNVRVSQDDYAFSDELAEDGYQSSSTSSTTSGSEAAVDAFRVGAASDNETFVSSSQSDSSAGEVIALRSQITQLEATIASSNQENLELTERISILERQLSDMNRLMSLGVEDADLANLEATLAEQNEASDSEFEDLNELGELDDLALSDTTDSVDGFEELADQTDGIELLELTDEENAIDDLASQDNSVITEIDDGITEIPSNTQADQPRTIKVKGSQGFLASTWESVQESGLGTVLAGVGGLLLAGLGLLVYRRRRADEEFEISMLSIETASTTQIQDEGQAPELDGSVNEGDNRADKETSFLTVYSDTDAVVQADEVDPIAEADVYIAYGRDEQAEEVLLDGIASNPARVDIKHKLLALYHKNENTHGFERVAEEIYAQRETISDSDWANVVAMGREISPDNPLFDDATVKAGSSLASAAAAMPQQPAQRPAQQAAPRAPEPFETASEPASLEDEGDQGLVRFDMGDEHSELDQVEMNALDVAPASDGGQERAAEIARLNAQSEAAAQAPEAEDDLLYDLDEELTLNADNISYDIDDDSFTQAQAEADATSEARPTENPLDEDSVLDFDGGAIGSDSQDDDQPTIEEMSEAMSDLDVASSYDEARTQYELAKVFVDLGDEDGAKKILRELANADDIDDDVLKDAIALLDTIDA